MRDIRVEISDYTNANYPEEASYWDRDIASVKELVAVKDSLLIELEEIINQLEIIAISGVDR